LDRTFPGANGRIAFGSDVREPGGYAQVFTMNSSGLESDVRLVTHDNADGTGLVKVTAGVDDEHPAWSPDATKIAFSSLRSGTTDIYVVAAAGPPDTGLTRRTNTGDPNTLTRTAHAGVNRVAFSGRIRGRALPPGRYEAIFTPSDAAGASPPQRLRFTIVKR
jgi:hypothetical protein